MRMLVIFFLMLNLFFAGWSYWSKDEFLGDNERALGNIKTIVLMHESSDVNFASVNPDGSASGIAQAHLTCHTLGPFTDSQMVEELKLRLQPFSERISVRNIEESEMHRYWVYLAAKNQEDAVVTSKMLALQNVADYYIVTAEKGMRVSIGHFKEKLYADKRSQQIKQLGFAPTTEVIYRKYQLYWLDYELYESQRAGVNGVISPNLQNDISLLDRDCEK